MWSALVKGPRGNGDGRQCVRAAVITTSDWVKQQELIFPQFWRLTICDQGVGSACFLPRLISFGVCGWSSSPRAFPSSSQRARQCPNLSCNAQSLLAIGTGPTPAPSFNLNYLFKYPFSKYSHILSCSGLGLNLCL